jgi:putative tryptophan/tyrosine transport system substrate-binding protein
MKCRAFITLLGGAAAAWPLAARAQPSFRRLGVLMGTEPTDAEGQARLAALRKALGLLGWKEGSDLETLLWWSTENTHIEMFAMQIVQLKPDVILSNGTPATISFQQQTKDIPVVFTMVTDPVGQGLVKKLGATRCEFDGFHQFRVFNGRQVARPAEGGFAEGRSRRRALSPAYGPIRCILPRAAASRRSGIVR